ncbi:hypothetical protein TTHERM_00420540 (macronuclear) [Tetrahymena thermophila SB210]|uniref:Uncharacterized protein n=1 Tax=Tetrahymena thermophila (strain SB210) TaxID=312017 RepID=I7LTQ1_TETTS|nr:hypothetical protein TTHERM_00420540 [Tetrahymena thermophila SB210]EAR85646.2 hypothetical protein TTHERM_00420540 [Tetrahymena thermophila SB210]|eukprot:XP_001033309.2 hypothetical protein TTHERM_00420540 [Tetrahymena thermophila SB210]
MNQSSFCSIHNDRMMCLVCLYGQCQQESRIICLRCAVRGHKHLDHIDKVYDISELLDVEQLKKCFLQQDQTILREENINSIQPDQIESKIEKIIEGFSQAARSCKKALIEQLLQNENSNTQDQQKLIQSFYIQLKQYQNGEIDHVSLNEIAKLFTYSIQNEHKQNQMEIENENENQSSKQEDKENISFQIQQCIKELESISQQTSQIFLDLCKKLESNRISNYNDIIENHKQSIQQASTKLSQFNLVKVQNKYNGNKQTSAQNQNQVKFEIKINDNPYFDQTLYEQLNQLETMDNLKQLVISIRQNIVIKSDYFNQMQKALQKNTNLLKCSISIQTDTIENTQQLKLLSKSIGDLKNLKELDLEICTYQGDYFTQIITESFLANLSNSLEQLKKLKYLKINLKDFACFSQKGIKNITTSLGTLIRLEKLNLSISGYKEESFRSLHSLKNLTKLKSLRLRIVSSNQISEYFYMELNETLAQLSNLEELELNFQKYQFSALSDYIDLKNNIQKPCELTPMVQLTGEYFNNLSQILKELTQLKRLFIIIEKDLTFVNADSFKNLCRVIGGQSLGNNIEVLFLKFNIHDEQMKQSEVQETLINTFKQMSQLKHLYLDVFNVSIFDSSLAVPFINQVVSIKNIHKIILEEQQLTNNTLIIFLKIKYCKYLFIFDNVKFLLNQENKQKHDRLDSLISQQREKSQVILNKHSRYSAYMKKPQKLNAQLIMYFKLLIKQQKNNLVFIKNRLFVYNLQSLQLFDQRNQIRKSKIHLLLMLVFNFINFIQMLH